MRAIKTIISEKQQTISTISIMHDKIKNSKHDDEYLLKYLAMQDKKVKLMKEIEEFYNTLSLDGIGEINYLEVEFNKQDHLLETDMQGEVMLESVKTGIDPFDNELFNSTNGLLFSTYFSIIGESNSGKSDIFYMLMASFVRQGFRVHFCSFEVGATSINRTLSHHHKNKLQGLLDEKDNHLKLTIDYTNRELHDLVMLIKEGRTMGCRIYMIDSLTKIKIKGVYGTADRNVLETVSETLLELAHSLNLLIIVTGQKSKTDIINRNYMPYGSIQVAHHLDVALYIDLTEDRESTQRFFWLEKNREDVKKGIKTDFNKEENRLYAIEYNKPEVIEYVETPWNGNRNAKI